MPKFTLKRLPTLTLSLIDSIQNPVIVNNDFIDEQPARYNKPIALDLKIPVSKAHRFSRNLIPISKAAEILHINPDTLRNWEKQGRLVPDRTPGGARRYNLFELDEMQKQMNLKPKERITLQPTGLPVSKAARLLNVSPDTIRNWDKKGFLLSHRTSGGARRFSKKMVLRLQEELNVPEPVVKTAPPSGTGSNQPKSLSAGWYRSGLVFAILAVFLLTGLGSGLYLGFQIMNGLDQITKNTSNLNQNVKGVTDDVQQFSSKIKFISADASNQIASQADVLGESFAPDQIILEGDTVIKGLLTAPNVLYGLIAGDNVSVTSGQTPKIAVKLPAFVSSFQGAVGNINLSAGTDISLSGLTINNSSTLSSVRSRGGCDNCLNDSDIQDSLTISSGGNISALAIKSDQLPVKYGGTGLSSFSAGDLVYADSANTLAGLSAGNQGSVLMIDANGLPVWTNNLSIDQVSGNITAKGGNIIVSQGSLCVGLNAKACQGILDAGTIYASNTMVQSADVAEKYTSPEKLEAGDVVMMGSNQTVVKAESSSSAKLIGVISTNPGMVLNAGIKEGYPVALSGRVPVKVSNEKGSIKAGDYLTIGEKSGVAVKAVKSGVMVGKAIEDFSCLGLGDICEGKINIFVTLGFADPGNILAKLIIDDQGNLVTPAIKTNKIIITNVSEVDSLLQKNGNEDTNLSALDLAAKLQSVDKQNNEQQAQLTEMQSTLSLQQQQIASLSAQITDLKQQKAKSLNLTPPDVLLATASAELNLNPPTESTVSGQLLAYESGVFSQSLKSFGETKLGSVIIAGDLSQDGTLSLSDGNTINALPTLFIQKSALAEIVDFFNGAVTVNKQGELKAQNVTLTELKVKGGKTSGNVKIASGQKSVEVESPLVTPKSRILLTATSETEAVLAVTSKVEGKKFTVTASKTVPEDLNFDWWLINEID